ncbi:MAG: TonB-dependent receptor [Bryobacteraceae bacterium]
MRSLMLLTAASLGLNSVALAQLDRASLSGTVTDASGAIVPDTKIQAVQTATQATFHATTNESGAYNFVGLPIGDYSVTAEMQGFNQMVHSNVLLTGNSSVRVDFTLTPGTLTEKIMVTTAAPLIEERSSAYGVSVQREALEKLPLQVSGGERSLYSFLSTVPGVSNAGFANNIMGGVGMYSQVVYDGVSAEYNPGVQGVMSHPPSVETIAEFKVVNSVAAEYGLTGGAFMSFVSKSGSNEFHGNAFEYLRNNDFDARTFFAPTVSIQKQNEFGLTGGGPVYIPKIYDGRNKTFFFATFTQFIQHTVSAGSLVTLPTAAFRAGDFSQLLGPVIGTDSLGRSVAQGQIYDPRSARPDGQGGFIRDPFPGNIIPTAAQSSVSQKWQSFLPPVTSPDKITNNFLGSSGLNVNHSQNYFFKIDQMMLGGRISGNYKLGRTSSAGTCILGDAYCGGPGENRQQSWRLAFNRNIRTNIINDFTGGVDRTGGPGGFPTPEYGNLSTTIGLKGTFFPCGPQLNVAGGYPGEPLFGNHVCQQGENDTNYKLNDSVSWLVGKHSIKFGASLSRWIANFRTQNLANGHFTFQPAESGLPGQFLSQTGFGYASFLLGEVDQAEIKAGETSGQRSWYMGLYVQDEYRASSKLTLNYGLRYEVQPQYTSPHDYGSQFDPSLSNPAAGNLPGALVFLGDGAGRNGQHRFSDTYRFGFGPRLGFAYKITNSTVVRGSYGLFNAPVSQFSGEFGNRQGFVPRFAVSSIDGFTGAFNWDNGFPSGFNSSPTIDPTVANGSSTAFIGRTNAHPAQVQMLNFSIQRELPGSMLFEGAYIGNLTHHISSNGLEQINQLNYGKYASLGPLLGTLVGSNAANAAGIFAPFPGFVGTVAQALRPYPQYQGINGITSMIGNSTYHAAQLKIQKRYSSGLSFLLGYTISKNLTDVDSTPGYFSAGTQDAYNRRSEKSLSSIDSPHQVVASYTYELPIGAGKRYMRDNVAGKYILGGWAVSGIHTYRAGTPIAVSTNLRLPTTGDSLAQSQPTLRPNIISGIDARTGLSCGGFNPATDLYLNRAAFTDPAPYSFGNAPRTLPNVRGCAYSDENISLLKSFPTFKERVNIRLGADFFNVFNRRHLGGPATNIDNANFGTISSAGPPRIMQLNFKILW